MELGAEISQKVKKTIKKQLQTLGCYVDDELPEYIMVMIANKRTQEQMVEDLNLFLNDEAEKFVSWLVVVLSRIKKAMELPDIDNLIDDVVASQEPRKKTKRSRKDSKTKEFSEEKTKNERTERPERRKSEEKRRSARNSRDRDVEDERDKRKHDQSSRQKEKDKENEKRDKERRQRTEDRLKREKEKEEEKKEAERRREVEREEEINKRRAAREKRDKEEKERRDERRRKEREHQDEKEKDNDRRRKHSHKESRKRDEHKRSENHKSEKEFEIMDTTSDKELEVFDEIDDKENDEDVRKEAEHEAKRIENRPSRNPMEFVKQIARDITDQISTDPAQCAEKNEDTETVLSPEDEPSESKKIPDNADVTLRDNVSLQAVSQYEDGENDDKGDGKHKSKTEKDKHRSDSRSRSKSRSRHKKDDRSGQKSRSSKSTERGRQHHRSRSRSRGRHEKKSQRDDDKRSSSRKDTHSSSNHSSSKVNDESKGHDNVKVADELKSKRNSVEEHPRRSSRENRDRKDSEGSKRRNSKDAQDDVEKEDSPPKPTLSSQVQVFTDFKRKPSLSKHRQASSVLLKRAVTEVVNDKPEEENEDEVELDYNESNEENEFSDGAVDIVQDRRVINFDEEKSGLPTITVNFNKELSNHERNNSRSSDRRRRTRSENRQSENNPDAYQHRKSIDENEQPKAILMQGINRNDARYTILKSRLEHHDKPPNDRGYHDEKRHDKSRNRDKHLSSMVADLEDSRKRKKGSWHERQNSKDSGNKSRDSHRESHHRESHHRDSHHRDSHHRESHHRESHYRESHRRHHQFDGDSSCDEEEKQQRMAALKEETKRIEMQELLRQNHNNGEDDLRNLLVGRVREPKRSSSEEEDNARKLREKIKEEKHKILFGKLKPDERDRSKRERANLVEQLKIRTKRRRKEDKKESPDWVEKLPEKSNENISENHVQNRFVENVTDCEDEVEDWQERKPEDEEVSEHSDDERNDEEDANKEDKDEEDDVEENDSQNINQNELEEVSDDELEESEKEPNQEEDEDTLNEDESENEANDETEEEMDLALRKSGENSTDEMEKYINNPDILDREDVVEEEVEEEVEIEVEVSDNENLDDPLLSNKNDKPVLQDDNLRARDKQLSPEVLKNSMHIDSSEDSAVYNENTNDGNEKETTGIKSTDSHSKKKSKSKSTRRKRMRHEFIVTLDGLGDGKRLSIKTGGREKSPKVRRLQDKPRSERHRRHRHRSQSDEEFEEILRRKDEEEKRSVERYRVTEEAEGKRLHRSRSCDKDSKDRELRVNKEIRLAENKLKTQKVFKKSLETVQNITNNLGINNITTLEHLTHKTAFINPNFQPKLAVDPMNGAVAIIPGSATIKVLAPAPHLINGKQIRTLHPILASAAPLVRPLRIERSNILPPSGGLNVVSLPQVDLSALKKSTTKPIENIPEDTSPIDFEVKEPSPAASSVSQSSTESDEVVTSSTHITPAQVVSEELKPLTAPAPAPIKATIQERCAYWPECKNQTCPYIHPSINCKLFPNCAFGQHCIYIHPPCMFGNSCSNAKCPFMHVSTNPALTGYSQICKYYPNCAKSDCPFKHVATKKTCHYGAACNNAECSFSHETPTQASSLKWVAEKPHVSERKFAAEDAIVTHIPVTIATSNG